MLTERLIDEKKKREELGHRLNQFMKPHEMYLIGRDGSCTVMSGPVYFPDCEHEKSCAAKDLNGYTLMFLGRYGNGVKIDCCWQIRQILGEERWLKNWY